MNLANLLYLVNWLERIRDDECFSASGTYRCIDRLYQKFATEKIADVSSAY